MGPDEGQKVGEKSGCLKWVPSSDHIAVVLHIVCVCCWGTLMFGMCLPQPFVASGWMYVNEVGQMCGSYVQEQLYEGLSISTGFLPDELPVYPVVNGTLITPVPLNYFKQFPDHVATGFAYLSLGISTAASTPTRTNSFASSHGGDLAICGTPAPAPAVLYPGSQINSSLHANNYSNTNGSNQPMSMVLIVLLFPGRKVEYILFFFSCCFVCCFVCKECFDRVCWIFCE